MQPSATMDKATIPLHQRPLRGEEIGAHTNRDESAGADAAIYVSWPNVSTIASSTGHIMRLVVHCFGVSDSATPFRSDLDR